MVEKSAVPLIFVVVYFGLSIVVFAQLLHLLVLSRPRHKLRSFKTGFNLLCFVWTVFRSVFWCLAWRRVDDRSVGLLLVFWIPHAIQVGRARARRRHAPHAVPWRVCAAVMAAAVLLLSLFVARGVVLTSLAALCLLVTVVPGCACVRVCVQFATFSLLAIFFAKVVAAAEWAPKWRWRVITTYSVVTIVMFAVTAVYAIMQSRAPNSDTFEHAEAITFGSMFILLSAVFAYLGWTIPRLPSVEWSSAFIVKVGSRVATCAPTPPPPHPRTHVTRARFPSRCHTRQSCRHRSRVTVRCGVRSRSRTASCSSAGCSPPSSPPAPCSTS
jgi:hypothetical protein